MAKTVDCTFRRPGESAAAATPLEVECGFELSATPANEPPAASPSTASENKQHRKTPAA